MKRLLTGFCMSFSLFTILPCPQVWEQAAMGLIIPFFPLIGGVIGGLWYGFGLLLLAFEPPLMLSAVFLLVFPLFLSGFIHMDGYMDTADAVFSRAELTVKRRILKDPHTGAFAVIALGIYLLTGFGAAYSLLERPSDLRTLMFLPMLLRSLAGIVILNAPLMSGEGYAASYRQGAKKCHTVILVLSAAACLILGWVVGGRTLFYPLAAAGAISLAAAFFAVRQLQGVNGDVSGFMITTGELCALTVMAVL